MSLNFTNLIIQNITELRLQFPFRTYHPGQYERSQFSHIYDLLPHQSVRYNATTETLKQTLESPLLLTSDKEIDLYPVFLHYLSKFKTTKQRTHVYRFAIQMNNDYHWLSFIEKALLIVIVCFIEPNFDGVSPGKIVMPGQIRNFLTRNGLTYYDTRCGFMSRFTSEQGIRQSIFSSIMNYDEFEHFQKHHADLIPKIALCERETKIRQVLLYFIIMCHELLSKLDIPKDNRLPFVRFMFDYYLDGEIIGLSDEQSPEYLRGRNTLVHKLLEMNKQFKTYHIRIMQQTPMINKFLYTGTALFVNPRSSSYSNHLNAIIPTIPVITTLYDNVLTCDYEFHSINFVNGIQLIDVLMSQCELKLINEIETKIIRHPRLNQYVYGWIECQVAARLEYYIDQILSRMEFDSKDMNYYFVSDTKHPTYHIIQSLIVLPRIMFHFISLYSIIRYIQLNPILNIDLTPLLLSSVQTYNDCSKDEHKSYILFNTLLLVKTLLLTDFNPNNENDSINNLQQINYQRTMIDNSVLEYENSQKHSLLCSRLFYYLFYHTYYHQRQKVDARIVQYFSRITQKDEFGSSSFGHLGSVLLGFMIMPFATIWVTHKSYEKLTELANGTKLKEAELDVKNRDTIFNEVALELRRSISPQRFFCLDETPNPKEYRELMLKDKLVALALIDQLLKPEAMYLTYHPDIVFGIMAMMCPKIQLTRHKFNQIFSYFPKSGLNDLNKQFYSSETLGIDRSLNLKSDANSGFHQQSEQANCLAILFITGSISKDNNEIHQELNQFLQKSFLFPKTSFDFEHSTLLPIFIHPGEIIDPISMSLLLQIEKREQETGKTRYRPNCPLFTEKMDKKSIKKRNLEDFPPFSPPHEPESPTYKPESPTYKPSDLPLKIYLDNEDSDDELNVKRQNIQENLESITNDLKTFNNNRNETNKRIRLTTPSFPIGPPITTLDRADLDRLC